MSRAVNRSLFFVLMPAVLLQTAMLAYDIFHPDIFHHADRSVDRMEAIRVLLSFLQGNSSLAEFLNQQGTLQGVPGDYLLQGLVFYLGGQYAVIVFQILLFIVSIAALYELTLLTTHSSKMSAAAALIYSFLPYGAVFPHMVWSESLFDPFTLISFYFVARCVLRDPSWTNISCAAIFLGLATLVRPAVLLWPIVVIAAMWLCRLSWQRITGYAVIFMVVVLAWPLFIWSQTGNFRMTNKVGGGIAHSADDLSTRMKYMIDTLPVEQRSTAEQRFLIAKESERSLPAVISRYVQFGLTYPAPFAKQIAHDVIIFIAQSGIERLTIDYFDLAGGERSAIQDPQSGWRKKLIDHGLIDTAVMYLHDQGTIIISSIAGALVMLLLWAFAGVSAISVFFNRIGLFRPKERIMLFTMMLFPIYVFLPGQLFFYPQARYRAPAEFCLCILAVIGYCAVRAIRKRTLLSKV